VTLAQGCPILTWRATILQNLANQYFIAYMITINFQAGVLGQVEAEPIGPTGVKLDTTSLDGEPS